MPRSFSKVFPLTLLSFFVLTILSAGSALAQTDFTVGVSPSVVELGEVARGSVITVKFNVVTPSQDPILIRMELEPGSLDFFSVGKYAGMIEEFSEEDATGWVNFIDNPIEVSVDDKPSDANFGSSRGWREVKFLLQVPADAEPGWHVVKINPIPTTPTEFIGPAGARVVSITSVSLLFRVPGEAKREGFILDVTPGGYAGNRLEVDTHFQNTGTVTISARGSQQVYRGGNLTEDVVISRQMVGPGGVQVMKSFMTGASVVPGEYDVDTEVSYSTGEAMRTTSFQISEAPPEQAGEAEEEFPYLIVIIAAVVVIVISIVIYKLYK